MTMYRKCPTKLFGDAYFRKFSKPQPCGQYLALRLMLGPETCIVPGVIYGIGPAGLSELLGWKVEDFRIVFDELLRDGFAFADFEAMVIFIPSAVNFNLPQSPNVVIGWGKAFSEIPECQLKSFIWQTLKGAIKGMPKAFQTAFTESCIEPSLNQEQEQEQNSGSRKRALALRASASATGVTSATLSQEDQDEDDEIPEWANSERPLSAEQRALLIAEDGDENEDIPY